MRDLCAVVGILVRTVRHRWHHSSACRGVAAQLVRDEPTGAATLCLQQFPKDPDGGAPIPSRLDEDVEDFAVLVHGSPRVLSAPVERDEELVEVVCSGSRCNMNLTRRSHGATTWPAPDAG